MKKYIAPSIVSLVAMVLSYLVFISPRSHGSEPFQINQYNNRGVIEVLGDEYTTATFVSSAPFTLSKGDRKVEAEKEDKPPLGFESGYYTARIETGTWQIKAYADLHMQVSDGSVVLRPNLGQIVVGGMAIFVGGFVVWMSFLLFWDRGRVTTCRLAVPTT